MPGRNKLVVIIFGLVALDVSIFLPRVADMLPAFKTIRPLERRAAFTDSLSHADPAPTSISIPSGRTATPKSLNVPPWDILRRPAANRRQQRIEPAAMQTPAWEGILSRSEPYARELFQSGMRHLRDGSYLKARLGFQTLIRTFPEDKAKPLAYWAMGLCFYKEGGEENSMIALDQFTNWLIFFSGEKGLLDFAEAAQIDATVIGIELLNSALSEKDRIAAGRNTIQALRHFLKGYPDSPGAAAAQARLTQIQGYLAGIEKPIR